MPLDSHSRALLGDGLHLANYTVVVTCFERHVIGGQAGVGRSPKKRYPGLPVPSPRAVVNEFKRSVRRGSRAETFPGAALGVVGYPLQAEATTASPAASASAHCLHAETSAAEPSALAAPAGAAVRRQAAQTRSTCYSSSASGSWPRTWTESSRCRSRTR